MPVARFEMPDGRIARFEVPEGTTPEQAQAMIQKSVSQMQEKPIAKTKAAPIDQGLLGGSLRAAGQGLTLGFSDELAGGLGALAAKATGNKAPIKDIYKEIAGSLRERQGEFESQHPAISAGSEIAGGLLVGAPAIKAAGSAPTLIELAKHGAKTGGMFGAAYGAGKAKEGETLKGAAIGGGTGAAFGGVLTPAVAAMGRIGEVAVKRVKDAMNSGKVSSAADDLSAALADDEAASIVGEIAKRSGLTPDDIANKLEELGEKGTLADVDENFAYLLHDAVSRFSPAKSAARKQFAERLLGEHGDVIKSLSQQFDNYGADDVYAALERSAENRKKIAGPLYDKAFASRFPDDLSKNPIFKVENVQEAMKKAARFASLDPDRVAVNKAGENVAKLNPVERLHYAKKALWDQAQQLKRSGALEEARLIDAQRKEIDKVLNSIPEYAEARKIWSSSLEVDAAADIGKDIFRMPAREFSQTIGAMNPHELEMAKMGALSSAAEKIEATGDKRSVARKLVENEAMRKKVKALFGSEEEVAALMKNADKWDTFRRTNAILSQQSRTREFTQAQQEIDSIAQAIKTKAADAAINLIRGERLNSERASIVANILRSEGLKKQDIDRLLKINRDMFTPGKGTAAISKAATMPSTTALQTMYSEKKTLGDYAR